MTKKKTRSIKEFAMTNQLIEHDLDLIESRYSLDLGRSHQKKLDQDEMYYPQIEQKIRVEAAKMAPHYETFYSLEKSVRALISDALEGSERDQDWWSDDRIPEAVRINATKTRRKEIDSGVTPRSDDFFEFCTFGELSEIIKSNWDIFSPIFSSVKAVERVMGNLNTLRGPIAHCSLLAEDEIVRLQLTVRDWFRLMS